jgi:hypothetical protein
VDNILQFVALWNEVQSVSTFNEVRYIFPANAVGSSIVLKTLSRRLLILPLGLLQAVM